jgi:tetratricopeptide (TPR) repeat protein
MRAETPEERERLAHQGLARPDADDAELRALLLRQLYSSYLERSELSAALEVAAEMVELEALGDIARQDAARVAHALGKIDVAAAHLRVAARVCPPDRRSFHLATLGALLRFAGRLDEALVEYRRAVRWAKRDRDLYRGQLVLVERAAGLPTSDDLAELRERLADSDTPKGYSLWVLGELSLLLGDHAAARAYLGSFLERLSGAPRAKRLTLAAEVAHARALLERLPA